MIPLALDADLVRRKMKLIMEDMTDVQPLAAMDRDSFCASRINRYAAERIFERMTGRMIDINYHMLVAARGLPPSSYFESFIDAGKIGALPPDFARKIAVSAETRSRLTHEWDDVEAAEVHMKLQSFMADLPEYLRKIEEYLTSKGG